MSGYYACFMENKVNRIEELLRPGKLINMKEADVHTGVQLQTPGLQ